MNLSGNYLCIAPQANVVEVQAFNGTGAGRYADVIAGINWIVANHEKYNIRVLNLSFGATPESYYWNDPVDQAVMAAWQAGIVVVVAGGQRGPDADDHRRARQRALCHHHRRADRQLHALQSE